MTIGTAPLPAPIHERVELLAASGDLDAALVEVRRALRRYPASVELWRQQARLCAKVHRHELAAASYEAALVLAPGDEEATDYFVSRARARGDHAMAVRWLSRRLRRYPTDAHAYARRALALRCCDHVRGAARDAATAIAIDDALPQGALCLSLRSIVVAQCGDDLDLHHDLLAAVLDRLADLPLSDGQRQRANERLAALRTAAP